MTEEEIQAFKKLQEIKLDYHSEYWEFGRKTDKEMGKWADTLIQLIKKQQKEIEKLNKYALEDLKDLNNYIPKHKIRELLKFHKEQIKLVGSHEFYNQELGYIEALAELLKGEQK